jgi:hypothetical protein
VNKRIFQLVIAAFCIVGCTAAHYHERQSDSVIFYLKAPEAHGVAFVSSLNAYSPHMARKAKGSAWVVTVAADSEFSYFYIVDGNVHVPECKFYEKDDFGSRNCVYVPE